MVWLHSTNWTPDSVLNLVSLELLSGFHLSFGLLGGVFALNKVYELFLFFTFFHIGF